MTSGKGNSTERSRSSGSARVDPSESSVVDQHAQHTSQIATLPAAKQDDTKSSRGGGGKSAGGEQIASGHENGPPDGVEDGDSTRAQRFLFFAAIPGWLASMILHMVVLVILAWMTLPIQPSSPENGLTLGEAEVVELVESPILERQHEDSEPVELNKILPLEMVAEDNTMPTVETDSLHVSELPMEASVAHLDPLGDRVAAKNQLMTVIGSAAGGVGFDGRSSEDRARMVEEGGGTPQSERAVELALKWFQRHQNRDGSWTFQTACRCRDPGRLNVAFNGATAMALLPFLGAGNTHMEGQYQKEVRAGLYFLLNRQLPNGALIDPGGNLYSHGLCAIALCEAYAMTQDAALAKPAQAALNYTMYAQDQVGGGWRYVAHQPGDTSAVGWQLMALKSGRMAYLNVNPAVFVGATRFLDSVQTDYGAAYGYKDPGERLSTTAIGLLSRMYLGWGRDEPALVRGVNRMAKSGPSEVDMYYNYYATQVMRHFEGEVWESWNEQMREFLVKSQATKGHEEGSWHMGRSHTAQTGGRLYSTSMATMVLEVYYRHMPLYRKQVTEDDFEF